jgi:hypothetical protein
MGTNIMAGNPGNYRDFPHKPRNVGDFPGFPVPGIPGNKPYKEVFGQFPLFNAL